MNRNYASDAMAAVYEAMESLHGIGAIDKKTMRSFDDACLTPIRDHERISQAGANYLNVATNVVRKREKGD